eukprot:8013568-Lingulodinium_polyedra.AAC.1
MGVPLTASRRVGSRTARAPAGISPIGYGARQMISTAPTRRVAVAMGSFGGPDRMGRWFPTRRAT